MGEIEYAMWANEQAVVGAILLFIGGIIGAAATFRYWEFAVYSILVSVLVLLFEWPRGKRRKGHTIERTFQKQLTPLVSLLGPVTSNYYSRFVFQLLMSVPTYLLLPTIMGGMCITISAFIYLAAAIKGEEWKPIQAARPEKKAAGLAVNSEPPTRPPPRPPVRRDAAEANSHEVDETRY